MGCLWAVVETKCRDAEREKCYSQAFAYTMKRYKQLSVCMENDALNIDNNPIEGGIIGIALGRKNFLFCGSHHGGQRSAMLIISWEHANYNKQPSAQIQDLLPHRWKELQEREPVL